MSRVLTIVSEEPAVSIYPLKNVGHTVTFRRDNQKNTNPKTYFEPEKETAKVKRVEEGVDTTIKSPTKHVEI
jgi:hypothetical protein